MTGKPTSAHLTVYPSRGTGISMNDTTTTFVAEDQRAEWNALMNQVHKLTEASRDMQREAGVTLAWGIRHPGSEEFAMKQALEEAQQAVDLWSEREALREQVEALPYNAVVRARIAERKAVEDPS